MEIWKNIEYDGVPFIVSNFGNVKIAARTQEYRRVRNGKQQVLTKQINEQSYTPQKHHTGYLSIELRYNGKRVRVMAHRLIALAHCNGYSEGLCVNHINGVKSDNNSENLEWVSLARNTEHAWEAGLVNLYGENQTTSKLTSKRVAYIRKLLNQGIHAHTLAVIADVSPALIYLIRDGKRWKESISKQIKLKSH